MSKVRFVDSSIRVNSGGGEGGGSSISASYALSSSHSDFATSASYAEYAVSASHEIVKEVSSSYADTASLAQSGNGPFTGSFTGSFFGNGAGVFSGSFSGSIPDAYQIISGSVSASISPNNGLKINSPVDITMPSGSVFTIHEPDIDQQNRLNFKFDQGNPILEIASRTTTSSIHLKTNQTGNGLLLNSNGFIKYISGATTYGVQFTTEFKPIDTTGAIPLGFYNRRWADLYLFNGKKISFGTNASPYPDLVSFRHTAGTNTLVMSGSSDVTLDVKGNIISTGSLQVSGSVDIAIPSGSAFTITETDKDQKGRLDFTFDDGDPTLEIEGRSSVAKIVLSANDGESNNLKIQSDGQVYASDTSVYTGSIKFKPGGIEAITTGVNSSPFIGSNTRPFYKYYMAQIGGQFISDGTYAKQQFFLNSTATGYQRIDGLYNQASGMRLVVSGSVVSGGDGYLRNPNNQYFQIQDDSTGTGNDASIPFRVGKSGSLAINLNQSKGFGFTQYYTASAMVHVEAEPNYDLNLFQGNDVSGNNVFEVDRDGNLTVDAEISASGDLRVRDGRFSRDGGVAEIEIIASEIAGGGIIGTQTSDNLLFRRFNIPKFTISESRNFSHQNLDVEGQVSASTYLGDGSQLTGIETGSAFPFTGDAEITGSLIVSGSTSPLISLPSVPTDAIIISGSNDRTRLHIYESVLNSSPIYTEGAGIKLVGGTAVGNQATLELSAVGSSNGGGNNEQTFIHSNQQLVIQAADDDAGKNIKFRGSSYGLDLTAATAGVTLAFITNGGSTVSELNMGNGTYIQADANGSYYKIGRSTTDWLNLSSTKATFAANVSSSATSTASFGTYLGDGSQLTGIDTGSAFPFTGDAEITGSLLVSGSSVEFKASGGTVFSIAETGSFTLGEGATNSSDTNVVIGKNAIAAGAFNIAMGNAADNDGQSYNIAIGSGANTTNTSYGIAIGGSTYAKGSTIAIGHSSTGGTGTVAIGYDAGSDAGDYNVLLGYAAGKSTTGDNNIIIGSGSLGAASMANQLRIGNGDNHIISGSLETGELLLKTVTLSGSLLNTGTVSISNTDSPYTLTGTQQFVLIDPSGGDVTINMPDAATYPGREIKFKLTQAAGANTVTLQRQGADTIDGATTYTDLDIQYESISTVSNGSDGWFIF